MQPEGEGKDVKCEVYQQNEQQNCSSICAGHSVIKSCEFDNLVKQRDRFLNSVDISGHAARDNFIPPRGGTLISGDSELRDGETDAVGVLTKHKLRVIDV
ncbi:Uncharacterized protein DAT39_004196 [Clarias magur]|uniref:Uncharacterized protein n=1 Tax=Clarias magur TaxID=1594786 RepID=A0A8J4UTX0_CLAMG|nr:Uncharacterized protein DAT39_004196 [Clarias magur]